MSAIISPTFMQNLPLINRGLAALRDFHAWFRTQYDVALHHSTNAMLKDAILIFESVKGILEHCHLPQKPSSRYKSRALFVHDFLDRAAQLRKQRPYFGDPRSHITRKKHGRPNVFSPLNSHATD